MFYKSFNIKFFTVCLLLTAFCFSAAAQKKTVQKDALNVFEKNIEAGKLEETERPLLDFALADPQNARALELLGRLRARQNRTAEAKALYKRALMLDANFTVAKINYGKLLAQLGENTEAREMLGIINETEIKGINERLNFAQALTFVGEFQKALEIAEKMPPNLKNSEALPVLAICYLELGDRTKFDALIPTAKKLAVSKSHISIKFAEIMLENKLNQAAIEVLRAVVSAAPKNARAMILLGKAEISAKDFMNAKTHLAQAEILQPQAGEVFFLRAMLENEQGNSTAALGLLEKAVALEPDSTIFLSQFVLAAMRANLSRKAIDAAKKLLTLSPNEPEILYLHGAASLQNGNLDAAQNSLTQLMRLRPNDSRGCLVLGLTLAAQKDQVEPARRQLEHCLEINPANFEAKYQLGLSYKAEGDTAKAISFFEETISLAPDYPLALRDLGAVYLQASEEQKARTVLEKSVLLAPNDSETHFQLSRLYNLLGEPNLARKHLEIFQKLKNTGGSGM